VLALAGIGYDHVKEPDYEPDRIRQNSAVTDVIKKVGETVLTIWQQRAYVQDQLMEQPDLGNRNRNIFYDTDGIQETQQEQIQICSDCAGALRIDSTSSRGNHILAIHIPRKACHACNELGHRWYDSASPPDFDMIYLQDRTEDAYLQKGAN
jgi:hypothetical protein